MTTDLLNNLNEQQRTAVSAPPGPTLVVAGPGSGKTAVLTRRVAYLVRELNVPAWRIMAVTFTNKAAKEMTHRIETLLGLRIGGLTVGTFHAICARILRREAERAGMTSSYVIYDTDDQLALMKKAITAAGLDPDQVQPRAQLSRVSGAKNELITPEEYPNVGYMDKITFKVYPIYQRLLREGNGVDFDDLLMKTVLLFRHNPDVLEHYQNLYDHILVDEFQDTNTAQYALIKMLAGERRNLFCVGDPDQSIYRFRGADYRNVTRFQSDFPDVKVILLEQNYRSHQIILDAAMAIIDKNSDRIRKQLTTSRQEGPKITLRENLNEDYEAMYIAEKVVELVKVNGYQLKDCAIMYRMNAQSRGLEESFLRMKIPYRLLGGVRFYGRKEVKDVLAYLRLIDNPNDSVSLLRILNVPARGIGAKTQAELEKWAAMRGKTPLGAIQDAMQGIETPFASRAQKNLTDFGALIATWQEARKTMAIGRLLRDILARTAYLQSLNDGTPEGDERVANVNELIGLADSRGEMKLTEFLEEIALVSDVDTYDETADSVVMLTLHTAKGLEFPIVFIVGLEEGTLPHMRALDDPEQLSEERRLMYVGITRAKDRLYLTWAHQRLQYGYNSEMLSSRFLGEIPEPLTTGSPVPGRGRSREERESYRRATTWDSGSYPDRAGNSGGSSKPWSPPKPGWNNPPRRPNRFRR